MIKIKNMSKKYGKNEVLKDINLIINDNESVAFLGGNGSGKTTLLEIIAGVQNQTSGDIFINDKIPENYKKIGIQFQEGNWPRGTTAKNILNFYIGNDKENHEKQKMIDIFEVKDFLHKDLNNLSGGQKQRFNALLAVLNNPEIIILDELITGLDLKMQIKLINFFVEYKEKNGGTLLVISHMPEEVELLCKRLILLENGIIILDEKIKNIQDKYGSVRQMIIKYYNEGKI